jgi:NADPH:quinone reductase-like Zn-dependent oxidoreductase
MSVRFRLRFDDASNPEPRTDGVLIQVEAVGDNPTDFKIRGGSLSARSQVSLPSRQKRMN